MPLSAAMRRFAQPDKNNPWFAKFKYSRVQGLGYERGVVRRTAASWAAKLSALVAIWAIDVP